MQISPTHNANVHLINMGLEIRSFFIYPSSKQNSMYKKEQNFGAKITCGYWVSSTFMLVVKQIFVA